MSKLEVRTIPSAIEALSGEGKMPTLTGYAATYNNMSADLGGFREIIRPGAFVLRDDVRALAYHDDNNLLGRTKSGTLQLNLDDRGVSFSLRLPDTTLGNDIAEMVHRGDLDSMSFGFITTKDKWNATSEGTIRELLGVDLHEISIVPQPAYGNTSVSMRAIEQAKRYATTNFHDDLDIRLKIANLAYIIK